MFKNLKEPKTTVLGIILAIAAIVVYYLDVDYEVIAKTALGLVSVIALFSKDSLLQKGDDGATPKRTKPGEKEGDGNG